MRPCGWPDIRWHRRMIGPIRVRRLRDAVVTVLARGIEAQGASIDTYRGVDGRPGSIRSVSRCLAGRRALSALRCAGAQVRVAARAHICACGARRGQRVDSRQLVRQCEQAVDDGLVQQVDGQRVAAKPAQPANGRTATEIGQREPRRPPG